MKTKTLTYKLPVDSKIKKKIYSENTVEKVILTGDTVTYVVKPKPKQKKA